jgi:hypothetical protein
MTRKTVAFNKPRMVDMDVDSADRWVGATGVTPEQPPAKPVPMKRFTIDVPADLHRRIKTECAREGLKMADMLREILETRFPGKS